jgi:hypothetical protein
VWLTPALEAELERYENALFRIATHERIAARYLHEEKRQARIDEMFNLFVRVTGEDKDSPDNKELRYTTIIESLRNVLGIAALTGLRSKLIDSAATTLKPKSPSWFRRRTGMVTTKA